MKIIIEIWGKKIIIKYVKIYLLSYTCIDSPENKTTSFRWLVLGSGYASVLRFIYYIIFLHI